MEPTKRDLLIGFAGWFLVNSLIWTLASVLVFYFGLIGFVCLILPANIAVFIIFGIIRQPLAGGMLAAYICNLLVTFYLSDSFWGLMAIPFVNLIYYRLSQSNL